MTRQRYTKEESVNRIRNLLTGDTVVTSDTPNTLQGPVMNFEEALSDIAELCANSLPSETIGVVPEVFVATVAEANAYSGQTNSKALTPASHEWAHEYGGIYLSTGSVTQVFPANVWTKITGTFTAAMENSGTEVTCDWNDDRIVINEIGVYFVAYQLSVYSFANAHNFDVQAFVNGVAQPQTRARAYFGPSGTVGAVKSVVGLGFSLVSTLGHVIDLRVMPDAAITTQIAAGQLTVQKQQG